MFYETEKRNHGLKHEPFKSLVVPRPIGWISTVNQKGIANLAPYSQWNNLTFDPPYVMLACNQNGLGKRKDTADNIEQTGEFVYNMVTYDLRFAMNITAKEFDPDEDEFEKAGLTKAPSVLVKPPRVAESPIQFECTYVQTLRLPGKGIIGTTDVIIGKVVGVHIKDEFIDANDKVDIVKIRPLARLGYANYCTVDNCFEIVLENVDGKNNLLSLGLEGRQDG